MLPPCRSMSRRVSLLIVLSLVAIGVALLSRAPELCEAPAAYSSFTEEIMAAPITAVLPEEHGAEAARLVFDLFRAVDSRMSEWKATSPLSAVNRAAGKQAVEVPADLRAVIRRSVEIGDLTSGAFDITWAALWGIWDFKAEQPRVPDAEEINRRVALVDYRRIAIDDEAGTVYLPQEGMVLGLGGIAKGYALDLCAKALRERGASSFLISAGGQTMLGGMRGDRPWRVGIRDPRGAPDDYFAYLELTDTSTSTSGDYESYFVMDGVRYHHIIDPRTGRPASPSGALRSATVISADATLADALSTALIILGTEPALALVEEINGVEAVLVDAAARVHVTSGLVGALHQNHPPAK